MSIPLDRAMLERLFEGAPGFLDRLEAGGPWVTATDAFTTARTIAHAMPESEQVELIDAHPRLGAPPGTVSVLSHVEQGYDRDADAPDAPGEAAAPEVDVAAELERLNDAAELERLNDAYEARFGFRYCVFVAGRPRAALLAGFAAALHAERDSERRRALDAVVDIAADRYAKLAAEAST